MAHFRICAPALTEKRGTNPQHRRAFFDSDLKIMRHAHGKLAALGAKMSLGLHRVAQLTQSLEVRSYALCVFKEGRKHHQASQL